MFFDAVHLTRAYSPVFASIQADSRSRQAPRIRQHAYSTYVQIRWVSLSYFLFSKTYALCSWAQTCDSLCCSKLDISSHQIKLQVSRHAVRTDNTKTLKSPRVIFLIEFLTLYRFLFICSALSLSARFILCGSDDNNIHVWDTMKVEHNGVLSGHENRVTSISVSPNGMALVSSSWDQGCRVWV